MTRKYLALFLILGFMACKKEVVKDAVVEVEPAVAVKADIVEAPKVDFPIYDFDGFEALLHKDDDKVRVVNFWATWCKPCIEELPYFEQLYAEQKDNGVEVILVSLDFPAMWETRLAPFVDKRNLQSQVVILDDPDQNTWIPKVDESWEGGIPATLIYNSKKRTFFGRGLTYEELNSETNKFLN